MLDMVTMCNEWLNADKACRNANYRFLRRRRRSSTVVYFALPALTVCFPITMQYCVPST